jgi:2-polyprenyl-3-methyl-5-hydroxy-6-metoxy-1,4-benzoquinol methylase
VQAKHNSCLVCSSSRLEAMRGYEIHQLHRCKDCTFVFMVRIPTDEELENHYARYSYQGEVALSPLTRSSYRNLLKGFEEFRRGNRILDVGCGRGHFLEEAQACGWEAWGTELSAEGVMRCREKNLRVHHGRLASANFPEQRFDIITSFEVLEHVLQPRKEVETFLQLLRPGGLFYCTTPNFNCVLRYPLGPKYDVITYPEHLGYFTPSTLRRLASNVGFETRAVTSTGLSLVRFRNALFPKKKERAASVSSLDESVRRVTANNPVLHFLKRLVNRLLTISGLGLTLKGHFIKPS